MRVRNAVTATVGAFVIAAALSGPAAAADEGDFTYLYPGAKKDVAVAIEAPADERCYNFEKLPGDQLPVRLSNDTDMTAIVYAKKNCKGEAVELAPGDVAEAAEDEGALPAKSVVFVLDEAAEEPAEEADQSEDALDEAPEDAREDLAEDEDMTEDEGLAEDEESSEDEESADGDRAAAPAAARPGDIGSFIDEFVNAWG
ncbi:hypothetical protein LG634_33930 [Streptomyces bambusae]|uniref:hypothetical protein n=1 Tax=Streptomyces bambusae TaxID=1550616 RepID=UPI001D000627|nr:hypothetical protein [Streptomyces bambusae]MCB5169788.1 hypothetical protein [Streptomyces bambusae]